MRFRFFGRVFYISKTIIVITLCIVAGLSAVIGKMLLNKTEQESSINLITAAPAETISPVPENSPVATASPTQEPVLIAVHITGCIAREGVYYIEDNEILSDAVELAGGLTEEADTRVINLAMHLHDGMHIHIPSVNDEDKSWILEYGETESSSNGADSSSGLVNINTATSEELQTLSGVGESTARDIISYRNEYGPFQKIEDIMNVPGIKEAKYMRIKDYITV